MGIVELRGMRETRVGERRRGVSLRGIRKTREKRIISDGWFWGSATLEKSSLVSQHAHTMEVVRSMRTPRWSIVGKERC